MKTNILTVIFVCIIQIVTSQNCEDISPYTEGMSLEYTNYNKKGKVRSVDRYVVKSVATENGELVIEIESTQKNDKNKDGTPRKDILKCVDGNFYIDMVGYLAHQNDDQKSSLQVKAEGDFVEFPDNISEGLELKDATIELKIGSSESTSTASFADMKIYNRNVLQNTSFKNQAGTFNAYKMTFDYIFTMGFIKLRGSGVEWYVKGVGIVKTESYTKKGKLRWTRELTKMVK